VRFYRFFEDLMREVGEWMLSTCFYWWGRWCVLRLPVTIFLSVFVPHTRATATSAAAFIRLWFLGFEEYYYLFVLHKNELVSTVMVQKSKV